MDRSRLRARLQHNVQTRAVAFSLVTSLLPALIACGPASMPVSDASTETAVEASVDVTLDVEAALDALDALDARPDVLFCGFPTTACSERCVDLTRDPMHCGGCGRECPMLRNGTRVCENSVCLAECSSSRVDCDRSPTNGCETNLETDVNNCGGCGRTCPSAPGGSAICVNGTCDVRCNEGRLDCDGDPVNGCEVNPSLDVDHCGGCGAVCPWPARVTLACVEGRCANTCIPGFANCDSNPANGCEASLVSGSNCGACGRQCTGATPVCAPVPNGTPECVSGCPMGLNECAGACIDMRSNPLHCGACGRVCEGRVNSQGVCIAGQCRLQCRENFADCNGDPADGCEVDLRSSAASCGACGVACPDPPGATAMCVMGRCGYRCNAGRLDCDTTSANGCEAVVSSSTEHCGGCGRRCEAPPNTDPVCTDSACGTLCRPGYADCDSNASNGCETLLATDNAHCGACGEACGPGFACNAGACRRVPCPAGRADCDDNPATGPDGCEVSLQNDDANCGACNLACAAPNARSSCTNGTCSPLTCIGFSANCDGVRANGCETTLTTEVNCGGCGNRCGPANAAPACVGLQCAIATCFAGFADCNAFAADGCEVNVTSSNQHCGGCNRPCAAGATCISGTCVAPMVMDAGAEASAPDAAPDAPLDALDASDAPAPCPMGQDRCGMGMGVCVNLRTDPMNCGMCGRACSTSQTCIMGACACATGSTMCGTTCTNTATDPVNCGTCGRMCTATQVCTMGACGCASGRSACGTTCVDLQTDPANCGGCGVTCLSGQSCAAGRCGGIPAPRPVTPRGFSYEIDENVLFEWVLPTGVTGARVEVCSDERCDRRIELRDADGTLVRIRLPPTPVLFWRLFGRVGAMVGTVASPTWQFAFRNGNRAAASVRGTGSGLGVYADVNGDGRADAVFSGRGQDRVSVALGTSPPRTQQTRVDLPRRGFLGGASIAAVGDVDGDGLGDVAIGAPGDNDGTGEVWIAYGSRESRDRPFSLVAPLRRRPSGKYLGERVAAAGDVNRDGFADVLAISIDRADEARVHVIFGGARDTVGDAINSLVSFNFPTGRLGAHPMAGAGDVDGDGFSDILVGTPLVNAESGEGLVFRGSADTGRITLFSRIRTSTPGAHFGTSVALGGDFDGDGLADPAIGGPDSRELDDGVGEVRIAFGDLAGEPKGLTSVRGLPTTRGATCGLDVVYSNDRQADARLPGALADELIVACNGELPSFVLEGIRGDRSPRTVRETLASFVGARFSVPGDFDGDGWLDLLLGARDFSGVFVFRGNEASYETEPYSLWRPLSGDPPETFGGSLATRAHPRVRWLSLAR